MPATTRRVVVCLRDEDGTTMPRELSSEQELFRQTAAMFLERYAPVAELRRLQEDPAGFGTDYWRRGADLGWASLLVAERDSGASISGNSLVDLALAAYEFGRHAAPGPLMSTNVVAAALSAAGTKQEVIARLMDGTALAAWAVCESVPNDELGKIDRDIAVSGDELVLNGVKRPAESADRASRLLVSGRTGRGLTQVLVPSGTKGVVGDSDAGNRSHTALLGRGLRRRSLRSLARRVALHDLAPGGLGVAAAPVVLGGRHGVSEVPRPTACRCGHHRA